MKKKEIVDDVTMKRAITRITYEIIERNKNLDKIVLAGIKTRGVLLLILILWKEENGSHH